MKSKTFFKRTLSLFLAILMFTSVVPAGAITAQAGIIDSISDFFFNIYNGQKKHSVTLNQYYLDSKSDEWKTGGTVTIKSTNYWGTQGTITFSDGCEIDAVYVYNKDGEYIGSQVFFNKRKLYFKIIYAIDKIYIYKDSSRKGVYVAADLGYSNEDNKKIKNIIWTTTFSLPSDYTDQFNLPYYEMSYENNRGCCFDKCEIIDFDGPLESGRYICVGGNYSKTLISAAEYAKKYSTGKYKVENAYLNIRSGAGVGYPTISTPLPYGTEIVISKISNGWGYGTTSSGLSGWVSLHYCSYHGVAISKPIAPTVRLTSPSVLSRGELINVSWDSVYDAKYYSAYLYNSSGALIQSYSDIYSTSATFQALEAGTYTVKVIAHNSLYSSDPGTLAQAITVKGPSTVTYLNDDGTVIAQQSVEYGKNATAPVAPEKKGYTFKNWNGSLTNITKDTTLTAEYTINQYIVNFVDSEGAVIESQMVTYGEDATPPSAELVPLPKEGDYVFAGWDSTKYLDVYNENKSDPIVINALYEWNNKELPITCKVTSASRQPDGYYVYFDLTNYPDSITRGRAVVALKTTNGKLVYMTESAAFSIPAGGTKSNMEVFVPCELAATVAEVIIVDSYSSGVPISAMQSSSIEQGLMWSEWLDELPSGVDLSDAEVESRQEYKYRDKEYTTASTKTKSGWTYYNTTSTVGTWSAWQWNVISGFTYEDKMREVATQQAVSSYNYKKQYNYSRWSNSSGTRFGPCKGTWNSTYCGNYQERGWSDSALGWVYTKYSGQVGGNYSCYGSTSNPWYNQWTREVVSSTNYGTQYRYRDTTYTHHFYKWDDTKWSKWGTTPITATSDRQVEEKTTYRYKSISAGIEDTTGVQRRITTTADSTFDGQQIIVDKLNTAYAGKNITLFISKYNASSDFTNEYVAQSTVGEDGSFTFDYVLREEPTVETGDYIISIGIEGTTCMQQIGVIEAPKPQYSVKFVDWDGTIISEQTVEEGKNAVIPKEIPTRDGYTFVGWNNSCTNIQSDLEVSPIYSENVYTVVYIDWRNETFETQTYKYGEPLIAPDFDDCDSGYAIGWDVAIDGETVVTSNMVVTAVYDTKTFTVDFYDYEGNVVDSQTVEYDGVAEIPELPEDDGVVYYDWDITEEDVMNVKENIAVFPSYEFEETTATPTASVTTGAYNTAQTVELSCETEDAVIYYTLDGSNPADDMNAMLYTEPIEISDSSTLLYYASSTGKNDSDIVIESYVINGNGHLITIENFDEETECTGTFFVESMSDIDETELERTGYTFSGFYYDDECTQPVDLANDEFETIITLYSKYTINSYSVKFLDANGNTISEQVVEYLGSATAPEMTDNGDYIFCGWEGKDFKCVTEDTEVSAVYKHKDEIVTLTFDRSTYTMDEGDNFTINTTISDNGSNLSLVWISGDESIATVDETGVVSAVGTGTTTIYAVTEDDSAYAECEIIVNSSPNYSICLKDLSTLGVDDLGYLREIPLTNNTVDNILAQLQNNPSTLTFTNASGIEITGTGLVGTGTVITLKNGDEVLDTMKAVMTGDITCDGYINNRDIAYSARALLGLQTAEEHQLLAMDANGDGKVNNRDVALLARYLVGKETL